MCIIIDSNALAAVFKHTDKRHEEYRPVLKWIVADKGKMVYGGSKYKEELKKFGNHYRRLLVILRKAGKLHEVDDENVDSYHKIICEKSDNKKFNDHHIIAIICASGCKLLCSDDRKSFEFIRDKTLYVNSRRCPRIYNGRRDQRLLVSRNIADCCKPCVQGSRKLKEYFNVS